MNLFDAASLDHAMTPEERRALLKTHQKPKKNGLHAAPPGTGPEGETCKSCAHLYHNRMAKTYLKCGLCQAKWTGGKGTDVRARDPACSQWQSRQEPSK